MATQVPAARLPIVHSDVLKALNLQSLAQEELTKVAATIVLPKPVEAGGWLDLTFCPEAAAAEKS